MKRIKKKLFSFIAKATKKQELTEAQESVKKYLDLMGPDDASRVDVTCPYCLIKAEQLKRDKQPSAHAHAVFKTSSDIDFVEHVVNKHSRDMQVAKVLFELLYIEAALPEIE
jgi:uncharacterized protein (DUF305 family)